MHNIVERGKQASLRTAFQLRLRNALGSTVNGYRSTVDDGGVVGS